MADKKLILTFENALNYIELVVKAYLESIDGGTDEERKKSQSRKQILRDALSCCYAGTIKERMFVKQFIKRILTGQLSFYLEGYGEISKDGYLFLPDNYTEYFEFDNPIRLNTYIKYLLLIYNYREEYGDKTLEYLIEKYKLARLRHINQYQGDSNDSEGAFIDEKDIDAIFLSEKIIVGYDLALDVFVQLIYEEYRGNSCIDELVYQNIDDIGIGLSGMQVGVYPNHLANVSTFPYAYDGAWIKYKGMLMHLTFLTFGNFANLRRVVTQIVAYEQYGSFSEKDGYKLGYGKDGSRRTAVITPFAENPAAFVRKFTTKSLTNRDLILAGGAKTVKNPGLLLRIEKALVRGGATIPICGPQGAGKTTKLEAISEYIQNWYAIRMIESEFEARIRWRYPEKNILTVQTQAIPPDEAYSFSLRSSGDIYIVSEVRDDEMMVNVTRTANRGGRSVIFTYHPNTPRATVLEIANSLIRQKLYTSLKDAMYTTLETVKCCIQIDTNIEKRCRYYNIYEFRPIRFDINRAFQEKSGTDRNNAFQETVLSYYQKTTENEFFDCVPIITYDRENDAYVMHNTISNRFYDELILKSTLDREKDELEKVFRPLDYVAKYILNHGLEWFSAQEFSDLIEKENVNIQEPTFKKYLNNISKVFKSAEQRNQRVSAKTLLRGGE